MRNSIGRTTQMLIMAAAALSVAVGAAAQATQTTQKAVAGAAKVSTMQLKGEVIATKGDQLVAKMIPSGEQRLFNLKPGKMATIDGVSMPLNQVKPGTILTADVTVSETPVVDRTVTTLKGTVWHAAPTTVILTLENGENRQYDVPKGLKFDVDGRMVDAMELRPGMKITATKVVEAPRTEIAQDAIVTGTTRK